MMKEALVSIIIVNWNGGEIFKNCLNSLSKIKYRNFELIVVDNGSIDRSFLYFYKIPSSATSKILIKNKVNLGFALANNQGFKNSKGEYVLLLNNDTKVTANFLSILIKKMEKQSDLGVIQPKIFIMDKKNHLDNVASYLTNTGFLQYLGYMEKDGPRFNREQFTFSAKGACMLIRREIIEKIGLFDCDFGSYFEETDFCWRVWNAGFKVLYYPRAYIFHKVGFSSKRQDQIFVNYHSSKNRILSMIKNLEIRNLIKIGGLHLILLILLSFYYFFKFQLSKAWMIWRAIIWNILNLNQTLSKRKKCQSLRIKSDSEIFQNTLKSTNWESMFNHFKKVEANFN